MNIIDNIYLAFYEGWRVELNPPEFKDESDLSDYIVITNPSRILFRAASCDDVNDTMIDLAISWKIVFDNKWCPNYQISLTALGHILEKITDSGYNVTIDGPGHFMDEGDDPWHISLFTANYENEIINQSGQSLIEVIYKCCVEFVKNYSNLQFGLISDLQLEDFEEEV